MLYLISGCSRSGKSMLAKKLLQQNNLPYLSLDWLMMGFNDGIPEYGIHHLLWPNEIAKKMWPFLQGMLNNMIYDATVGGAKDYVIEGEALLPELISPLMEKHPKSIKAIFIGYTDVNIDHKMVQIKQYSHSQNDWLCKEADAYIKDHIGNMMVHSKMIKAQCSKYDLPFFDTSADLKKTLDEAMSYLIEDAQSSH
jgi:hypothetical protein